MHMDPPIWLALRSWVLAAARRQNGYSGANPAQVSWRSPQGPAPARLHANSGEQR